MTFDGAQILITGGLGFIGSHLARRLLHEGARVTLIDSLIPEYGGNLHNIHDIREQVKINISDVRDPFSMKYLVQEADFVFNLAGQTSHLDSMHDPYTDLEINSRAQLSILEALRHHNPQARMVFASTRQIYGRPQYLPVDETHPLQPVDINGINKLAGEHYHRLYNEVYGLKTSVLRLTNTYGPGMRIKDARQTFLGIWIRQILNDQPFEVWGGEQLRDFNYVDDVATAFLNAASRPEADGGVYNLGASEITSLRALAEHLVAVAGKARFDVQEFPAERKRIDIGDYYTDYTLAEAKLGWSPTIGLNEGLARTLDYYRKYGKHYQ